MANPTYGAPWPPPPGPAVPPRSPDGAYKWFVVYVVAMLVLYVLCTAAAVFVLVYDFDVTSAERDEIRLQGGIFLVGCVAMLAVFAIGLFLPRKPWAWVYGLVLLGLGLTSCCTWPATIPLLIQWLKPEMKARFGSR